MKVKGTIEDYKRKHGNNIRVLETVTNIYFKDRESGLIRMYDRKMNLIDETAQAEKSYRVAIRKKLFTWKAK